MSAMSINSVGGVWLVVQFNQSTNTREVKKACVKVKLLLGQYKLQTDSFNYINMQTLQAWKLRMETTSS